MELSVFDALVEQLKDIKTLQTVMFGGFGEPSSHKDILYMIGRVKSLGVNKQYPAVQQRDGGPDAV